MEIRTLTADDASEYWRLRLEALQGDPEAFSASAEEHVSLTMDEVRRRLGADGSGMLVIGAFEDGLLVGMAGFYSERGLKSRHKGRIWGVYVTPAKRGEGVGRKVLQTALDRGAATPGIEQILLSVTATQTAAIALYRSLGFESFGREPRALKVSRRFVDEEYMILRLEGRKQG
jgi:ribosomal protein S18 acetylase RimI-like enzyme